jgi:peptide/nickel transport system substrate-binding protein
MFPFVPDTGEKTEEGYVIGNNVTADLAIRQAVNYAVDREALVAGVLEGYGSAAFGPVSGLAWEEPKAIIEANLNTAKEILVNGGWADSDSDGIVEKDGLKAEFTIIYPASDSTRQALALAAADMIKAMGIQVNVEGKSWEEIETLMHSNVIVFGWGSHDQTEMWNLYHSSMGGVEYYNTGYYANKEIDNYLDLAMGAPSEAEAIAFWQPGPGWSTWIILTLSASASTSVSRRWNRTATAGPSPPILPRGNGRVNEQIFERRGWEGLQPMSVLSDERSIFACFAGGGLQSSRHPCS